METIIIISGNKIIIIRHCIIIRDPKIIGDLKIIICSRQIILISEYKMVMREPYKNSAEYNNWDTRYELIHLLLRKEWMFSTVIAMAVYWLSTLVIYAG